MSSVPPLCPPSLSLSLSLSPMASHESLTDYERRRLENIRRNGEVMASLLLQHKASDLSAPLKRHRPSKTRKPGPDEKKGRLSPQGPVIIRRSLRARGISPPSDDGSTHSPLSERPKTPPSPVPDRKPGPLLMRDALVEGPSSSDHHPIHAILAASGGPQPDLEKKRGDGGGWFDPRSSLVLRPDNVGKILKERILSVVFFPFAERTVVAAGSKFGNVGFWDVDSQAGDGVCEYSPHSALVSGISIHPFSTTKMYTSSYDGFIRLMDIEKETFNMIYSSDYHIFSICLWPHDTNSLCLGEGSGELKVWDERAGKASSSWVLHENRINTIDFNPGNSNLMATSSTDGKACIWDLRSIEKGRPKSIKTVQHHRAVHSAFFSPSGSCLATTSIDDRVGIMSGSNFEDLSMIKHCNKTGRWLSSFRAIWGWDDSYLFMGNMKRTVDVITAADKTTTALESPYMTSIPCRFAAHPFREGSLACSTAGGKVYLWTKES